MIITVSRQFGSGGREIGKRLADALQLEYYDRELVSEIAAKTALDEGYVSKILENGGYKNYAFSFGRSLPVVAGTPSPVAEVLIAQQNVIKAIGNKGNCVIVGRSADAVLKSLKPFRIFVYADNESKLARCRKRAPENEHLTDKQMLKRFKEIDKGRKNLHDLVASKAWGDKDGYDLLINTSNIEIKEIVPALVDYITSYYKIKK